MSLLKVQSVERLIRGLLERDFLQTQSVVGTSIDQLEYRPLRLFEIEGFVELPSSEILERTISFLAASAKQPCPIIFWLNCDGKKFRFFYGFIPNEIETTHRNWLEHSLKAFFPGSQIRVVNEFAQRKLRASLNSRTECAAICGLPSERQHTEVETRLDEALDGITNIPFDLLLIAEPIDKEEYTLNQTNMLQLANVVSTLANTTITEQEQQQFVASMNQTLAEQSENRESQKQSSNRQYNKNYKDQTTFDNKFDERMDDTLTGSFLGAVVGGALGCFLGPAGAIQGAMMGAAVGGQGANLLHAGEQRQTIESDGTQHQESSGESSESIQSKVQKQEQAEQQIQRITRDVVRTNLNRDAQLLEEVVTKHLERWNTGGGVGMWKTSVHVLTNDNQQQQSVCDVLSGALRGDNTYLEPLKWMSYPNVRQVTKQLERLHIPKVKMPQHPILHQGEQLKTHLNTYELAHWLRPPARELSGFTVRPALTFGRTPPTSHVNSVEMGKLIFRGSLLPKESIHISNHDLSSHALLVGTTGAGKTTTVRKLLWELQHQENPIPFMVIEPAKSEYEDLFDALQRSGKRPVRLVAGRAGEDGLHINPLQAPTGLPLGRHVDWIKTILLSCFSMQESLPQILERVLLSTYERAGLSNFHEIYSETDPVCPTLADFDQMVEVNGKTISHIDHVISSMGYGKMVKANLLAAMRVRLLSLVSGVKSVIFQGGTMDWGDLLNRPVFIQLSDVVEPDVRRLIMGSLIGHIYGHREAAARSKKLEKHQGLRHLLLLEEAHHLIKKADSNNPLSQLINQVISDAFAELRAYGQGILVADQSPALLDTSVIRNTNVKLIHRLLYAEDCSVVGDSMGLVDEEKQALRYLQTGECLFFKGGISKALHLKVEPWSGR